MEVHARAFRVQSGWTQVVLALYSDCALETLRKLERGDVPERANMPHSKSSCQKTTYRRYRKGAFFFLFPLFLLSAGACCEWRVPGGSAD